MSASSEFEPSTRQGYGSTTSSESVFEQIFDRKLAENMSTSSIRAPILRAVSISPIEGDPEPDSTNLDSNTQSSQIHLDKEVEYHLTEKRSDPDMSVDTLSGIVRIEDASLDNIGHLAYPIQGAENYDETNYVENANTTLIQAPLNTTIVQNVTKLPQNFTINVDATVSNLTALQTVSQDVSCGQTLWLPTIITTSAATDTKTEEERSEPAMSQIMISEGYITNDSSQAGPRRGNIITENYLNRPKTSKVQILSNVSIPKSSTYTQQFVTQSKDIFGTPNQVYKLNTNLISQKNFNNSVLSNKTQKSQSLISCPSLSPTIVNNSPGKNISYGNTITKGTNLNKTLNNLNNGANLNAMVAVSSGNTQCHILSRVVSGPNKLSVHSGRKSVNASKSSKSNAVSCSQKQSRTIKIIQQTGSTPKSDAKNWSLSNTTYKNQQPVYNMESNSSKIIQKVGSPTHKSQTPISLQKVASKGECLVLQSPCGPVLISTAPISTCLTKAPHYVQSGPTPNLRYVHTYGSEPNQIPNISQVSANQQLTAQILQSLSQPKLMMPSQLTSTIVNHSLPPPEEEYVMEKPTHQKRIVFGDPFSTSITSDGIVGMEERPNLTEELERYTHQSLAFAMLDHTYSLPIQQHLPVSTSNPIIASVPTMLSPPKAPISQNTVKQISPVTSTSTYELINQPLPNLPTITSSSMPVSSKPMESLYTQQTQDDDAGSITSSLDGDRRGSDRGDGHGSDTDTAPEVEEDGKTRCICGYTHDDGYMICCDRCGEWQHVDCMGIDRQNIPDVYMCEVCSPRSIDRRHAQAIQIRKREELNAIGAASDSDSSEYNKIPGQRRKRLLTVTTYTNTSGSCVTTYNSNVPTLPPLPTPTLPVLPKRGTKRPKKPEVVRKVTKRKLTEKRVKRKKEMMLHRNKYNSSISNSSHWHDTYESAMTNHYSPELRAKIMKYSSKLGSSSNMASAITAHLCTTVPHAGGKILIATKDLKENTPVIELRGKYMLSNQHRPQLHNSARIGSQKPGPFVFFYRLPKDNTQICIDTRTYGNEARFVRRSCKPNAEFQHCIIKGALHIFLLTIGTIQSNTEITVGHDVNGSKQPCACGNPKHCKVNGFNTNVNMLSRKSIDYPPREKRSRNRSSSMTSPLSPPPMPLTPVKDSIEHTPIKSEKKSPIKQEVQATTPVKKAVMALNFEEPLKTDNELKDIKSEIDLIAKEEMKPEIDEPDCAIKFERPESPIPEVEIKKEEIIIKSPIKEDPVISPKIEEPKELKQEAESSEDEKETQEKSCIVEDTTEKNEDEKVKEVTAKSACHDRSSRSSRTCINQDSMDDKTDDSQDKILTNSKEKDKKKMTREERKMEAIMKAFERMEKAQQRKQEVKERQKRRESDPHPNATEKDEDDDVHSCTKKRRKRKGRARTTSQSNRRRLNSADSDMVTSGDDDIITSPRGSSRRLSSSHNSTDERNDSINEDIGLSSACLLVEAAVGSVESAFKLPKTKKTMATEWIGRSPERTPSPYRSPYRSSLVSATSLESLVRVASTIIGDLSGAHSEDTEENSPPRTPGNDRNRPPKKSKRITRSTPPQEVVEVTPLALPQHSAKKRWLRQAISEESDSPNAVDAFVSESPPNEMVTPLKKRRLARESLSCEQSTVPCNEEVSPNLTSEDSPVKEEKRNNTVRNIMESLYTRDRSRSDSGQGSDDPCNIDNDILSLKGPHDSENIRRIIGAPLSVEPPMITKIEDIKTLNNNLETVTNDENSYNKVVPMEIDTTITLQSQIKDTQEIITNEIKDDSPKLGSQSQSADTSGNSSPQRDEMDDIQKKIHSFHTENILILKSRNKKPPKEKRKKVNLNFDLNMVDDQISIQLRTEEDADSKLEINGDIHDEFGNSDTKIHFVTTENIPLPTVETIPLPSVDDELCHSDAKIHFATTENIPLPSVETIPLPYSEHLSPTDRTLTTEQQKEDINEDKPEKSISKIIADKIYLLEDSNPLDTSESINRMQKLPEKAEPTFNNDKPSILNTSSVPFASRFNSTGLFSGIFSNMTQNFNIESNINENVPNMQIIKSVIDRSTSLESSIFDKDSITPGDELKSVQEILTRVNNMDSNNSVLLSGVLKSSDQCNLPNLLSASSKPTTKPFCPRSNDPRLNPPPVEKPKTIRRKLSISEYRKRHKGATGSDCDGQSQLTDVTSVVDWSSSSSGAGSMSPQRLEAAAAAAADELEQRLHNALSTAHCPKGVFNAQPTASERQRENLSSRLRREFGLALPDDEESRPPMDDTDGDTKQCER